MDEDTIAGMDEFEEHQRAELERRNRLANVRPKGQLSEGVNSNINYWENFCRTWIDFREFQNAQSEDQLTEPLISLVNDHKQTVVGWYPSSSTDLRPVLISRTATLKLNDPSYREPSLWIFSDIDGSQWAQWTEGEWLNKERNGIGGLIQKCWKLDPEIPVGGADVLAMCERARAKRYSRLLQVALESPAEDDFSTFILLLDEDDSKVFDILRKSHVPITHSAFTCGFVSQFLNSPDVFTNLETLGARWIFDQNYRVPEGWVKTGKILKCGNANIDARLVRRP
jgi:hypothetical protein